MKRLPTKIMSALAIVLLFAYIGYNLYLNSVNNIYTQYAVMITENTTADADCIVIRDEVRGSNSDNKALIRNNKEGVYIPYVKDGSRVAAGDTIALFFKSANDAKIYMQITCGLIIFSYISRSLKKSWNTMNSFRIRHF